MNPRWLLRLARLVRNPPSRERQIMMVVVLIGAAAIGGFEWIFGWPDWLTVNDLGRNAFRGTTEVPQN